MTENSNIYETFNWRQPSQLFNWILHLVRNPASTAREIAGSRGMAFPLILVAMNIASVFVASIICIVAIKVRYSSYLLWVHIPFAGIIILAVLMATVFDFGLAGLLFVSTDIIFRQNTTFAKMLSMVSAKVAIDSIFVLAGSVLMFISNFFFSLCIIAGNIISFTILVTVYNEEVEIPSLKKLYSFSLSVTVIFIVLLVLLKAVSSFAVGSVLSYVGLM